MPIVIALHRADTVGYGLLWGGLASLFFGVIPFAYVLRGVRLGLWSDHHVGERQQRRPVFIFSLASMLLGVTVLVLGYAPRGLVAFMLTLLIQAGIALAVTLAWKVSLHTWVASIGATALIIEIGPWALLLWPVLVAVAWSRVELEDHTPAQSAVGAVLGLVCTAGIFTGLN